MINYQVPKDIDTYVHRIGRTGRMGVDGVTPGVAYTLISSRSPQDRSFSVSLVKSLQDSGQESSVTPQLLALAQSDPQWRVMTMNRNEKSKKLHGNEKGLGLGLTSRQALTSSMLANQTSGQSDISYGDGVQKAFSKIMGNSNEQTVEVKKRKSRFSSAPEEPTPASSSISSAPPPAPSPPTRPSLPGFVRASNLSMTSTSSNTVKKSRWG